MFNNVKIDGLKLPRPRPRPWNSSTVHQFICVTFSFFSRKTLSTAQISSSFHSWMLEKPFPPPSEVVSTDLPPTPEISSGLGIMRELSHITKPVIRHILFSTHSLPHFAACLHSNPRQQDWIQLVAYHGHRSATSLDSN